MFGKKKPKVKLDDNAKAAVLAASAQGAGANPAMASGTQAATGAQLMAQALQKYNKRMRRVCKAGAIFAGVAVLLIVVGALLVHFLKAHIGSGSVKSHFGFFGIACIVVGFGIFVVAILLLVWAYHLLSNRDREESGRVQFHSPSPGSLPESAYPRQKQPGGAAAADAADGEGKGRGGDGEGKGRGGDGEGEETTPLQQAEA